MNLEASQRPVIGFRGDCRISGPLNVLLEKLLSQSCSRVLLGQIFKSKGVRQVLRQSCTPAVNVK